MIKGITIKPAHKQAIVESLQVTTQLIIFHSVIIFSGLDFYTSCSLRREVDISLKLVIKKFQKISIAYRCQCPLLHYFCMLFQHIWRMFDLYNSNNIFDIVILNILSWVTELFESESHLGVSTTDLYLS